MSSATFQVLTDAGLPYHEAVSKAAQVPGSLGSPGFVPLLRGLLLFEHSLGSCMVCQHPLGKGSEKMGQGLQRSNETSSETPISRDVTDVIIDT